MSYIQGMSSQTQDLIMLNFEFFGKKLLLFIAIAFSFYYLFYYWKRKKESPYLMTGIGRILLYICSWICLLTLPMFIFFLYPQVRLDTLLNFMLLFYSIGYMVAAIIIMLNIFYYGSNILAKFANINVDPKTDKVFNIVIKETAKVMGFKWGKNKKKGQNL